MIRSFGLHLKAERKLPKTCAVPSCREVAAAGLALEHWVSVRSSLAGVCSPMRMLSCTRSGLVVSGRGDTDEYPPVVRGARRSMTAQVPAFRPFPRWRRAPHAALVPWPPAVPRVGQLELRRVARFGGADRRLQPRRSVRTAGA